MKSKPLAFAAALGAALLASTAAPVAAKAPVPAGTAAQARPNFLVIIADDLGFSDLGAFGSEIATPNLDKLALDGLRLTGFHTAPTCSPTRSMLLSGTDNHRAGLGSMAELTAPNQKGKPGYEGYLSRDVASLAERLQAGGYRTLLSGKWHLGLTPDLDPHARGFQHSFALLQGGANHYGRDQSAEPGAKPGGGATYTRDGQVLPALDKDFYSSDTYATNLISELRQSRQEGAGKPFFAYLAFTAPHWPLQAPEEDVARQGGKYDAGFDEIRRRRLARQEQLGVLAKGTAAHSVRAPRGGWDSLSASDKREAARDMEIYAAMVERMDRNVGRVIEALRASGELDNTVIVFLADNGAEGLDYRTTGAKMLGSRVAEADNSFANRGKSNSYITYGTEWAQAGTAPSWLTKAYASEGGTRTVAFVSGRGLAHPGGVGNAYVSVADIAPTLLDYAGVPSGGTTFQGRTVLPITGKSARPWLEGKAAFVHAADEPLGTELFGSRALRKGDWKITDIGDGQWRLFDIARDPGETQDLSARSPEKLRELAADWDAYAKANGVILPTDVPYRP
ncbi:arylsulfatase [Novosphingobium sp. TCA1]|uniref:Arylsulfatase n=1 Tax=Novosphingobium pentaromativorans TaxID=205844 RepID=A0A2W5QNM6_9SPHN|nr:arylsulfatase [Novosphingobium sp. TCA1]PZQ53110.1 MAG: arylsulfatase [Novosphingobium pentaromativorans]GFE75029.1 arylsulfatase [Novosphingobium sp. TCA1]